MSERTSMADDMTRCTAGSGECHLCGDEAVVCRVIDVDVQTRMATVTGPDGLATVALDLIDASIGDTVLVHLGFAIERMGTT